METPVRTPEEEEAFNKAIEQASVIYALAEGSTRSAACRSAGMGRLAFYRLLENDEIFNARVAAAEARAVDSMEGLAYTCAEKAGEDPRYLRALFFWLKCRAGWVEARPLPHQSVVRSGDGYPHAMQASEGLWHTMPHEQARPPEAKPHEHHAHEQPRPSPRVPPQSVAAPRNEPARTYVAAPIDPYEAQHAAEAEEEARVAEEVRTAEEARAEAGEKARAEGEPPANAENNTEPLQPAEKPVIRVPFVPSENAKSDMRSPAPCRGTPPVCPPSEPAPLSKEPSVNPKSAIHNPQPIRHSPRAFSAIMAD